MLSKFPQMLRISIIVEREYVQGDFIDYKPILEISEIWISLIKKPVWKSVQSGFH
jgi:hypothetical protein